MSEGLLKRIGRLVSASANLLVDSLKNAVPTMVMAEAIRKINSTIVDVRAHLGKVEAAIARQMDIEAMIPVVEKSIADSDAEINELNSYIQALQAKNAKCRKP